VETAIRGEATTLEALTKASDAWDKTLAPFRGTHK